MPPVPSSLKRMTANPSRPARHRPGKAVPEEESSEEDEDEEEPAEKTKALPKSRPQARPSAARAQAARHDHEDDDDEDEEGFVTEDEDNVPAKVTSSTAAKTVSGTQPGIKSSGPVPLRPNIPQQPPMSRDEDSEEESSAGSESEDDSDSGSDASSSPEPQRKLLRPTFIKKTDRKAPAEPISTANHEPRENTEHTESTLAPSIISATTVNTHSLSARRLDEAEALIKQRIERDTLARLQGRKNWDDDDDLPPESLVDDTDNLDPDAEHSAWRLREMRRLKRDREALIAREKEIEEVERRRGLTAEEREKEDREHLDKQRVAKEGRGEAGYLSKYHHKGAFFMDEDDEAARKLRERQFAGARFQDEVADKSTLPEYLRVRDGTKVGKKGRTRYTDLKGEDTGRWGDDVKRWRGSGYGNDKGIGGGDAYKGVDERFRPDDDRRGGGPSTTGANSSMLGQRRRRSRSRSRDGRDRDASKDADTGDSYRPERRRRRSYSRSRSRSRSPRRSRTPPYRSRRSPSPYSDRDRDKRRRIEA